MPLKKAIACYIFFCLIILEGCKKMDENFRGDLTESEVGAGTGNTAALLRGVYTSMQATFTSHLVVFPLQEFSSDEMIAPIRGTDWADNNVWRVLHLQTWTPYSPKIKDCFNALNGISYAATDLLRYHPGKQEAAEARLIRAWVMYLLLDLFDQVPYRDPGESLVQPARVLFGTKALDFIIQEIYSVEKELPITPVYKANQYAAQVLLMKCYLNKAVYKNRVDSPEADKEDMDKVINLADSIITNNAFSLSENYFDNFAPDNTINNSRENIFTILDEPNSGPDNLIVLSWLMSLHYNQYGAFGGANGFTTLSDFYDKFEPGDLRRGTDYKINGYPLNIGHHVNVGFLVGQQYDLVSIDNPHDSLYDYKNYEDYLNHIPLGPLAYTREVHNLETGANARIAGIRGVKYYPDFSNFYNFGGADNDFVFFRFPDVLLMKAEAILRNGTPSDAGPYGSKPVDIVNFIRTHPSRNASKLPSVDLDMLLDERGRELWWEGWRRQDMIRFKKFLLPVQEREYTSDPKYLVYPIPAEQLAVNPNLKQNPGY